MPKFSIVTVCYNAEKEIERTIKSVLGQTYENYEYIIIDGRSTDSTVKIATEYSSNPHIKIVSEKDKGIYDAMNKGISLCGGEYINFLNAGDVYHNNRVLEMVSSRISLSSKDIYYGEALYIESCGKASYIREAPVVDKMKEALLDGFMPNHQTIFAKINCFKDYKFNEHFLIAADFDWFFFCFKNNKKMEYIEKILIDYYRDGVSSDLRNNSILENEHNDIIRKNYPLLYALCRMLLKKYV